MLLSSLLLLFTTVDLISAEVMRKIKEGTVTVLRTHTSVSLTSLYTTEWKTLEKTSFRTQTGPYIETPTARPTTIAQFSVDEILYLHNKLRARHGASNLIWDDTLYKKAQAYANNATCDGVLVHSNYSYGENLALGYNTSAAVNAWYDEQKDYNYNAPGFRESTGHFTQLIWKNTKKIGCAYLYCGPYYGQYTVCEYDPAGNVEGQYSQNVIANK